MKDVIRKILAKLVSILPKGVFNDQDFFEMYQEKGVHVLPVNFYSPIPDTSQISNKIWETSTKMIGLEINLDEQVSLLAEIHKLGYLEEYHKKSKELSKSLSWYENPPFSGIDGALLFSLIRKCKPKKYIEVGSGYSTLLAVLALEENKKENTDKTAEIVAIEPYPKEYLKKHIEGVGELIVEKVENVSLSEFESLGEDDILFIDSSHVVRIGGDVNYEILEILPRLKKGVLIHFHDIYLPLQYPKDLIVKRHAIWSEQYLLQAFLAFNSHFEVIWSAAYMHINKPEMLSKYFSYYDPQKQQAGSFWIRKIQ